MTEEKNIQFTLGKLEGKMDGIVNSMVEFSKTFSGHSLSDERNFAAQALSNEHNFAALREQMAKDKEEMAMDRVRMAKYVGGTVVVVTFLSYLVPVIVNKLL